MFSLQTVRRVQVSWWRSRPCWRRWWRWWRRGTDSSAFWRSSGCRRRQRTETWRASFCPRAISSTGNELAGYRRIQQLRELVLVWGLFWACMNGCIYKDNGTNPGAETHTIQLLKQPTCGRSTTVSRLLIGCISWSLCIHIGIMGQCLYRVSLICVKNWNTSQI